MVVEGYEGAFFIAGGVDGGSEVDGRGPTTFNKVAAPDVHATLATLTVADEIEGLAVDGKRRLRLPAAGVDGGAEVLRLAPATAFAVGDIEVAPASTVRTSAGGKIEDSAILGDAACTFVVVAVEGLGHADGFGPFAVNPAAEVKIFLHGFTIVAGEEEHAAVGGECGEVFVVAAVDVGTHVAWGKGDRVGHGIAAEGDALKVVFGSCAPPFVFAFVGAEEGTQMVFGTVKAVVSEEPCGHGEMDLGEGGFCLEGFLKVLKGFVGIVVEQSLTLFELADSLPVVDSVLGRGSRHKQQHYAKQKNTHSRYHVSYFVIK